MKIDSTWDVIRLGMQETELAAFQLHKVMAGKPKDDKVWFDLVSGCRHKMEGMLLIWGYITRQQIPEDVQHVAAGCIYRAFTVLHNHYCKANDPDLADHLQQIERDQRRAYDRITA